MAANTAQEAILRRENWQSTRALSLGLHLGECETLTDDYLGFQTEASPCSTGDAKDQAWDHLHVKSALYCGVTALLPLHMPLKGGVEVRYIQTDELL